MYNSNRKVFGDQMFYIYILKCSDDTLYTGYTVNIENRLNTHNAGLGAKYTRGRLPVTLMYHEEFDNRSDALKREYEIKQLSRSEKLSLINQ